VPIARASRLSGSGSGYLDRDRGKACVQMRSAFGTRRRFARTELIGLADDALRKQQLHDRLQAQRRNPARPRNIGRQYSATSTAQTTLSQIQPISKLHDWGIGCAAARRETAILHAAEVFGAEDL
jgi:hypothetical protein